MTTLKQEFKTRNPKGHWFDADTMKYFQSRVGKVIRTTDGGPVYFVTSERHHDDTRQYSARVMDEKGKVETIGKFNSYTRSVAEHIVKTAKDKMVNGRVCNHGSLILGCIKDAEKYEKAGDMVSMGCQRRNARYWMEEIKHSIHWLKGLVMIRTPDGELLSLETWKERTMLNLLA